MVRLSSLCDVSSRSGCATTHRVHRAEDIPPSCSHSAKARPASPRSLLGGWSTLSSPRRYAMPRNCGSIRARLLDKQYGGSDLGNVSQYGWSPKRDKRPRNEVGYYKLPEATPGLMERR